MLKNRGMPMGLIEAIGLTRAGRVVEATALIQRILGHGSAPAQGMHGHVSDPDCGARSDAIDVEFSEIPDPANRSGGPAQETASDVARRFNLEGRSRGWRDLGFAADLAHPQATCGGEPGQFISGSYANQAGTRPYKLYIPAGYVGQALPLVVMLHGCNQTPDDFATGTRMNALAEDHRFFVLYPEQTGTANHSRCWNWFKRGDQRRDRGEPAILAGMTRDVMSRYLIEASEVYVAGLSAGGAMAAVMGTAYPELYAAVGVHSGLACGSAHDLPSALAAMRGMPLSMPDGEPDSAPATSAIPTIVFHGDRDKTVHPRNGDRLASQSVEQNGASGTSARTECGEVPGGHAYTRTVHCDSTGRVVLEHWLVHGGGHAWFGGSPRGSYVDPRGPNAAREMIRFFYQSSVKQQS